MLMINDFVLLLYLRLNIQIKYSVKTFRLWYRPRLDSVMIDDWTDVDSFGSIGQIYRAGNQC